MRNDNKRLKNVKLRVFTAYFSYDYHLRTKKTGKCSSLIRLV